MRKYFYLLILILIMFGCSAVKEKTGRVSAPGVYYEIPPDFNDPGANNEVIEKFSEFFSGLKIFIDPGHGGEDRRGRSPSGEVVEADINLKVALHLREFLSKAGAIVVMSREDDSTVDLKYRSVLADESGADLFLSIHHNAPGGRNKGWINFTSTFYHARPGDYEHEPFERDLARYIQRDLAFIMGNSGGLGSFDGTYSDYSIYEGDGFSVLRETKIAAVLTECSFFTNPMEIARLQIEEFNRLQAWGIFKGMGRFFQNGAPEITFLRERSAVEDGNPVLFYSLEDDSGIDPSGNKAFVDSLAHDFEFNPDENILKLTLDKPEPGEKIIRIICKNNNGIHSMPYERRILVK